MILASFFAALGQLTDARFRGVLLTGVGLTLALLIAFSVAFVWFIGWAVGDAVTLPLIGEVTWVNDIASWGGALVVIVLSTFLMVPVASGVTSMFLDQVAQAVEDEHYPQLGPALPVPFLDAMKDSIGFLAVLIGANLLALVLYIMFAPFAPLIFWGLNGFLLGREYFTLAAMRRIGRKEAKALRSRYTFRVWMAGILMAIPLSVPVLNLLVPIVGAATFTHLFHRLAPQGPYDRTSPDPAR